MTLTTAADTEFLFEVYAASRDAEMALVPWTEAQKRSFLRMQLGQSFPRARDVGDVDHGLVEDGHILDQAFDIRVVLERDFVLNPVGERQIAEAHALLQDYASAVVEQEAVFAREVPLFHPEFPEEGVEGMAMGPLFGGVNRNLHRVADGISLGFQGAARFGQPLALLRQCHFHKSPEATATKPGSRIQTRASMGIMLSMEGH
jgi:hypothetical protein